MPLPKHHVFLKSETMASKKPDIEDEVSRPLSKLPATPVTTQPVPSCGLWAPNDDFELTVEGGHVGSSQIHLDLELTIRDRYTWSLMMQLWHRVDFE